MNSILLYLVCGFITASRCWKPLWRRASCVQPFLFMQQRKIPLSFVFFSPLSSSFMPNSFQRRSFAHVSAALSQACMADMCHVFICFFLREATLMGRQLSSKRGRRLISRHLLVRPNLQFIIVPQPCRKRGVTLGGRPATHLSDFTPPPRSSRLFSPLAGSPCPSAYAASNLRVFIHLLSHCAARLGCGSAFFRARRVFTHGDICVERVITSRPHAALRGGGGPVGRVSNSFGLRRPTNVILSGREIGCSTECV